MKPTQLAQITNPVLNPQIGAASGNSALALLMANLFRTAVIVGGLALLLFIAWGGLQWITAGGDKTKVDEARARLTNAVLGLAIVAAAWAIFKLVNYFFGLNIVS